VFSVSKTYVCHASMPVHCAVQQPAHSRPQSIGRKQWKRKVNTLATRPQRHNHENSENRGKSNTNANGTPRKYVGNSKFVRIALHEISLSCPNRQAAQKADGFVMLGMPLARGTLDQGCRAAVSWAATCRASIPSGGLTTLISALFEICGRECRPKIPTYRPEGAGWSEKRCQSCRCRSRGPGTFWDHKMLPTYNRKFVPGPQKRKRTAAVRVLVHPPQVNRTLCGA